jgi:asparagine synthase (glutamine-hydrolysing)
MSAICGWINARHNDDDAAAALRAMAEACKHRSGLEPETISCSSGAMVTAGGLVPVSQRRNGQLLAAVMGHARWESADLARIAEMQGAAAAALCLYEQHGADCVTRMHGPFALAISDGARRKGLLAVDRMAIRTLCHARVAGGLAFGTTVDGVIAHPGVPRHLSMQGIFNYLYQETVPAPGTIHEGVTKLLPGQRVIIDGASVSTDFYWQLDYGETRTTSDAALRGEFLDLLRQAVARAATSDSDGAFLSGGTDSSTVVGMLTRLRGQPVDTYSIGFEAEGFDEMDYARIASRHFGSRAHEYYVTPRDVAEAIPLIAAAYDEPFGNASAVPTYCCARLARNSGTKLLLAGDGGDELFGGNARYAKQKVFEWYGITPSFMRRGLIEPLLLSRASAGRVPFLRKARSYVQQANVPLPDRLEAYNFLEREVLGEIFEPGFLAAVDSKQPLAISREIYARTSSTAPVNRMMHLDLKKILADNDLRKVNVTSEMAGIEVRYPMLDEDLVAFSGRLSPSHKVNRLRLRHFFKDALKDFLPPETIAKPKHGFGLPFGLWMERDATLREIADDSLTAFRRRGLVKPVYLDRLLHQHQASHATYFGVMIWIIMMLEQWLQANGH